MLFKIKMILLTIIGFLLMGCATFGMGYIIFNWDILGNEISQFVCWVGCVFVIWAVIIKMITGPYQKRIQEMEHTKQIA